MSDSNLRPWLGRAAASGAAAAACIALVASPAGAAPAAGTNLVSNGNFAQPGPAANEGATPTGWAVSDLGAETDAYAATIGAYDANGKYPPPAGDPDPNGIGDEEFYEAGSATGVEGIGGTQTSATFGSITNADDPQVSFSDLEEKAPSTTNASWAGSGLEVDFTSGGASYSLIYLNPWQVGGAAYPSTPTNTATTKYILGPTLTAKIWNTQSPRDLDSDISTAFGLSTFTVADVQFVELEDTISSGSPYPNMTAYFADIDLAEGAPAAQAPEVPYAAVLPVAGLAVIGAGLGLRRRRRQTA
jgi:hypothetical protein